MGKKFHYFNLFEAANILLNNMRGIKNTSKKQVGTACQNYRRPLRYRPTIQKIFLAMF